MNSCSQPLSALAYTGDRDYFLKRDFGGSALDSREGVDDLDSYARELNPFSVRHINILEARIANLEDQIHAQSYIGGERGTPRKRQKNIKGTRKARKSKASKPKAKVRMATSIPSIVCSRCADSRRSTEPTPGGMGTPKVFPHLAILKASPTLPGRLEFPTTVATTTMGLGLAVVPRTPRIGRILCMVWGRPFRVVGRVFKGMDPCLTYAGRLESDERRNLE